MILVSILSSSIPLSSAPLLSNFFSLTSIPSSNATFFVTFVPLVVVGFVVVVHSAVVGFLVFGFLVVVVYSAVAQFVAVVQCIGVGCVAIGYVVVCFLVGGGHFPSFPGRLFVIHKTVIQTRRLPDTCPIRDSIRWLSNVVRAFGIIVLFRRQWRSRPLLGWQSNIGGWWIRRQILVLNFGGDTDSWLHSASMRSHHSSFVVQLLFRSTGKASSKCVWW